MINSQSSKKLPPSYQETENGMISNKSNYPFMERYPIEVSIADYNPETKVNQTVERVDKPFVKHTAKSPIQLGLIMNKPAKKGRWIKLTFKSSNSNTQKKHHELKQYSKWISYESTGKTADFLLKYSQFIFTEPDPKSSWQLSLHSTTSGNLHDYLLIDDYNFKRLMKTFEGHDMCNIGEGKLLFKFSAVSPDKTITFIDAAPIQILNELELEKLS